LVYYHRFKGFISRLFTIVLTTPESFAQKRKKAT